MKKSILIILLIGICCNAFGQDDTLRPRIMHSKYAKRLEKVTSSRLYKMTYIAVPLIVGGVIVQGRDKGFRSIRNNYAKSFNIHYDDYLQYAPMAIMVAMKAGGVESRSSWGRMLTSDAFSAAIMAGVVNAFKYTMDVERPDDSNRKSFPSGHTATAFMAATMLHKEYGHRSAWYSVAGYSMATVTGVSRMLNNKHWMSDVMVGAGIGILSTEIGYWLTDLIFKDRGINYYEETLFLYDRNYKLSFLGLSVGCDVICGTYYPYHDTPVTFSAGVDIAVEGAWFITPNVGVGGRLNVSSNPIKLNSQWFNDRLESASSYVGTYFSHPITPRWFSGWKVLGGYEYYKDVSVKTYNMGGIGGFGLGVGHSMMYRANESLNVRLGWDYYLRPPLVDGGERLHMLSFSTSVNIAF